MFASKEATNNRNEHVIEEIHELPSNNNNNNKLAITHHLSPGQQVKILQETKALFNAHNTRNRIAMQENYNIQLPLIEKRNIVKV